MKNLKIDRLTLVIVLLVIVSLLSCLWGSQYYYPKNYLPAKGKVTSELCYTCGGNGDDSNYLIAFQTQDGQKITYQYQISQPESWFVSLETSQLASLHYNVSNPQQVRIKPSSTGLIIELLMCIVVLPLGVFVLLRRFKKYGIKALFTYSNK